MREESWKRSDADFEQCNHTHTERERTVESIYFAFVSRSGVSLSLSLGSHLNFILVWRAIKAKSSTLVEKKKAMRRVMKRRRRRIRRKEGRKRKRYTHVIQG